MIKSNMLILFIQTNALKFHINFYLKILIYLGEIVVTKNNINLLFIFMLYHQEVLRPNMDFALRIIIIIKLL